MTMEAARRGIQRLLSSGLTSNIIMRNNDALPNLLASYVARTRTFTSAGAQSAVSAAQTTFSHQPPFQIIESDPVIDEDEQPTMTMPSDLSTIARLNPELFDVISASQEHERSLQAGSKQQVTTLLQSINKTSTPLNVTKTNLNKLKIDALRNQLEALSADTRGNKAALVQRILTLVEADESNMSTVQTAASDTFQDGVVSSKALARQQRLNTVKALKPHTTGISEQQLQSAHKRATEEAAQFSRVFRDPHEAARLLVEARAEDICIIDVQGQCSFTDYMVLATTRSRQLARDLASGVLFEVKQRCAEVAPGVFPVVEGGDDPEADWFVVDCGNVVVHVFLENSRQEYDLEGLWGLPDASNIVRVAQKQSVKTLNTLNTIRAE